MLFDLLKAILFGIVEGICEWLPISSTGHLILLEEILSLNVSDDPILNMQFRTMFEVVIQLGAILAVVVIYFNRLNPFERNNRPLWIKLILATLPAAAIGFAADALCQATLGVDLDALLFVPQTVASALIIYGIAFILLELSKRNKKAEASELQITNKSALAIGFFQALAIIPGTSRSGATILGARLLGLDKKSSTEFSFFAAVPAILGASFLKIIEFSQFMISSRSTLSSQAYLLLTTAFFTAFAVSVPILKLLISFLRGHSFIPFGIYRILLGITVFITL